MFIHQEDMYTAVTKKSGGGESVHPTAVSPLSLQLYPRVIIRGLN